MKQDQVQFKGMIVSDRCRTYSYEVIGCSGDTRQFTVEVALELFRTSPLKFQDGPLISRERVVGELERGLQGFRLDEHLNVLEPDIVGYMARHYPPKARTWNPYKH